MSFQFGSPNTNQIFSQQPTNAFGSSSPATNSFVGGSVFGQNTSFGQTQALSTHNPMKSIEVVSPPEDSISSLSFSPPSMPQTFLIAGSWDSKVSCWEISTVNSTVQTVPKAQQSHSLPVLDVCWSDDGTRVFSASCDKTVKMWDLASNQAIQVAQHDGPVKTCHWIKAPNYSCLMTGSWDNTLKFWDTRSPTPMSTINLPDKCYCADVSYPMAIVGLANKQIILYNLEGQPQEAKRIEPPLRYQYRCISIFNDKKPVNPQPNGFAVGSVEGRVAIQYVAPTSPRDNFTFKCHRSTENANGIHEIFAVNDIAFHPQHGTLATVGSDGKFSFWDKDARTKLKTSEQMEQPITRCSFSAKGELFAYAVSYDWSKGHEYFNPRKKNYIFLHSCYEDLKPRATKK